MFRGLAFFLSVLISGMLLKGLIIIITAGSIWLQIANRQRQQTVITWGNHRKIYAPDGEAFILETQINSIFINSLIQRRRLVFSKPTNKSTKYCNKHKTNHA
jgi:hypothetical protein